MLGWLALFASGYGLVYLMSTEYRPARHGALLCTDPAALPGGRWNSAYDGAWLGAQACLYDPAQYSLSDVPPVTDPRTVDRQTRLLVYVNGANHRVDWTLPELHLLAQQTGGPVVAVYNATEGGRVFDAIHDARQGASSPPVATLADAIVARVSAGQEIHLKANSQGAIHLSHALTAVRARLAGQLSGDDLHLHQALDRIRVETAGGAASRWIDGPRYVHYVNRRDPVPARAGVLAPDARPGAGPCLQRSVISTPIRWSRNTASLVRCRGVSSACMASASIIATVSRSMSCTRTVAAGRSAPFRWMDGRPPPGSETPKPYRAAPSGDADGCFRRAKSGSSSRYGASQCVPMHR